MTSAHLSGIDLNLLVALDALLREAHVTRAAARIGLTQSAMSRSLARLRDVLGDPLLVRTGRGMRLTPRAERLAPALGRVLAEITAVLADGPRFDPRTAERTFTMTSPDFGEALVLPPLIERLSREAPAVNIDARASAQDPFGALEAGELDFVLMAQRAARPAIVWTPLFPERFVCLVREGNPAASRKLTAEQFAAIPQVLVAPEGRPGSVIDDVLAEMGLRRRVAVRVASFIAAPEVVASSDLMVTLPERIAARAQRYLPLRTMELPFKLKGFTLALAWHERMRQDPGHAWFRALAASVGQELKRRRAGEER
ncbi:LysR family transcriptional regulator [Sorangium sp. So ce726]|uniref:LysR family transcriptional regulator n=1 Tax=Sorangium sp. So ce726 TaxID=3133319 RepID=UPI003F614CBB